MSGCASRAPSGSLSAFRRPPPRGDLLGDHYRPPFARRRAAPLKFAEGRVLRQVPDLHRGRPLVARLGPRPNGGIKRQDVDVDSGEGGAEWGLAGLQGAR
jgi:hypothetical protein